MRKRVHNPPLYVLLGVQEDFSDGSVARTRFDAMLRGINPTEVHFLGIYFPEARQEDSGFYLWRIRELNGHRIIELRRFPLLMRMLMAVIALGVIIIVHRSLRGIYVRNFLDALCALPYTLPGVVLLIRDVRGIATEESVYKGRNRYRSIKFTLLRNVDRFVMLKATVLVCVSETLRRYLAKEYGIQEVRCYVIPNFSAWDPVPIEDVRQYRKVIRQKLGLSHRLVLVYSGGTSPWQCLPETLHLFKAVKDIEPKAYLLLLTRDVSRMAQLVKEVGLPPEDCRVERVPFTEMREMLCAADWGIALRDNSILNRVASPTKIAEYLSSGVPVVITDSIGDYSSLVETFGLGVVTGYEDLLRPEGRYIIANQILAGDFDSPNANCIEIANEFSLSQVMEQWKVLLLDATR